MLLVHNDKIDEKQFYFYNEIYNFMGYFHWLGMEYEHSKEEIDEAFLIVYSSMVEFYYTKHHKFNKDKLVSQFLKTIAKGKKGNTPIYNMYLDFLRSVKNGGVTRETKADIIDTVHKFVSENQEDFLNIAVRNLGIGGGKSNGKKF